MIQHVENDDYDQVGFSNPDCATYGEIGHLSACDPTGTSLVSKEAEMMEEEEEGRRRNEDQDYIRCLEAVTLFAQLEDQAAGLIGWEKEFTLDHLRGVEDNGANCSVKRSRGLAQHQSESRR